MKRILRLLTLVVSGGVAVVVLGAVLFVYLVYTPDPELPQLSGSLTAGSIEIGGLTRTYSIYVPRGLTARAPVVLVMHGSGENAASIRRETGYGFERLADTHHFAVAYPNAHRSADGDWNACGTVGAPAQNLDDVRFLLALVDKLATEIGVDPDRAFAAGSSRGGFMALRLALEAPSRFHGVAAVSAGVHTRDNFKCKPAADGTSSVLLMNGTADPLVPFDGGNVSLLGFSYKYGAVMSARQSAQYFADLNHIGGPPAIAETRAAGGVHVKRMLWRGRSNVDVELIVVEGGGHGIPQPYRRHPRLLGPSPTEPNGPEVIWDFFDRQVERPREIHTR